MVVESPRLRTESSRFERSFDRSLEESRGEAPAESGNGNGALDAKFDDPGERMLENFLRRYGLDEGRLDEGTLESIRNRLAAARSLEFYERDDVQTLLWARTLGDMPMILGALAFTAGSIRHLWAARERRPAGA